MTDIVTLRTGREVHRGAVVSAMTALEQLTEVSPVAWCELVMLARNPSHRLLFRDQKLLASFGLLRDDGSLHDATRDIVLASAEGDGLDMCFVSPY